MNRKEVMKRIITGVLSAAMVFGDGAPALLAQENGSGVVEAVSAKPETAAETGTGSGADVSDGGQVVSGNSDADVPADGQTSSVPEIWTDGQTMPSADGTDLDTAEPGGMMEEDVLIEEESGEDIGADEKTAADGAELPASKEQGELVPEDTDDPAADGELYIDLSDGSMEETWPDEESREDIGVGAEPTPIDVLQYGDYNYTVTDGQVKITGYNGTEAELIVPETIDGYPVTKIGGNAFWGYDGLKSIKLPSGLRAIGESAFSGCRSLTSINLPSGVVLIERNTFANCSSLTDIELPPGLTSIGSFAFDGCTSLTYIDLPSGVTEIGDNAFRECGSLTSIDLPSGVTEIGDNTFENCDGLESIDLPSGLTSIGSSAFMYCSSLTNIDLPSGVTEIGWRAFLGCRSLTSINLPLGVTEIGKETFMYCSSLTDIELPSGLTEIGEETFHYCSSLTDIDLPSGVTKIGWRTFSGCRSLTSINLPSGLKEIGFEAFWDCSSLTDIDLPSGVTEIGGRAFWDCSSLTDIDLPSGVTEIGGEAFSGCRSLTSINLPSGVTEIGYEAFYYCELLEAIDLPEGLKSINERAFGNCKALKRVFIPANVTGIDVDAFVATNDDLVFLVYENSYAEDYVKENRYTYSLISRESVNGCSFLYYIENDEAVIRGYERDGKVIDQLTVPETLGGHPVTKLDNVVLEGVRSLSLPSSLRELKVSQPAQEGYLEEISVSYKNPYLCANDNVLYNADKTKLIFAAKAVEEVWIPDSVTSLAEGAFANTNVSHVGFGKGLSAISARAFENTPLVTVKIPYRIKQIGARAFYGCQELKTAQIPTSVTDIGAGAFANCPNLAIYGTVGSYAEAYAKENNIPFNVIRDDQYVVFGNLENVDLETWTLTIEGSEYEIADDYDVSNIVKILAESEDKGVLCFIRDGVVQKVDLAKDMLSASVAIWYQHDPLQKVLKLEYKDGAYSQNDIMVHVQVKFGVVENDYYTASDLVGLDGLTLDLSGVKTELKGDGMLMFVNLDSDEDPFYLTEMTETDPLSLKPGESKTYEYKLAPVGKWGQWADIAPKEVKSEMAVAVQVRYAGREDYVPRGQSAIKIHSQDRQEEIAAEKRAQKEAEMNAQQEILKAREMLAHQTHMLVYIDDTLGNYFTTSECETIQNFITVWIAEALQVKNVTFSDALADELKQKVWDKVLKKMGVSTKIMLLPQKTTTCVSVKGMTKDYGERQFTFYIDMDNYHFGNSDPFAGNGTITYNLTDTSGIPSGIPTSGMGYCVFADLKQFSENVEAIAEAAVRAVYKETYGKNIDKIVEAIISKPIATIFTEETGGTYSDHLFTLMTMSAKYSSHVNMHNKVGSINVYNCLGELCGVVRNNEVDPNYNEVYIDVDGDSTDIYLTGGDYRIELVGGDTGTVDYTLEEYENGELKRTLSFHDIPMEPDRTYEAEIPENILRDKEYYALQESGTENEIQADEDTWDETRIPWVYTEDITLDRTELDCGVGDVVPLVATVLPEDASEKGVTWDSSDESVATVDEDGTVTVVGAGSATITAKTVAGAFTAVCEVSAHEHVWNAGVTVTEPSCTEAGMVLYTCTQCDATREEEIEALGHAWGDWEVTTPASTTVREVQTRTCDVCGEQETKEGDYAPTSGGSQGGSQTQGGAGTPGGSQTQESAGTQGGAVSKPVLELTANSLKMQVKQSTKKFKVTKMAPGDALVSVKSGNTKIVKVSKVKANGTFRLKAGKKTGKAKLTVKLRSGLSRTIWVKVQKKKVKTSRISGLKREVTLDKGKTLKLKPVLNPVTSQDKISYKSSKKSVATVSRKGVIRAKKKGTAKITVRAGKKKFTCTVTVR